VVFDIFTVKLAGFGEILLKFPGVTGNSTSKLGPSFSQCPREMMNVMITNSFFRDETVLILIYRVFILVCFLLL
jgi:hypothetical protein